MRSDEKFATSIIDNPNTKVFAVDNRRNKGFNLYLNISGHSVFIMFHRHNYFLYDLMKGGKNLSELKRWSLNSRRARRNYVRRKFSSVNHIIKTVEDYIYNDLVYMSNTADTLFNCID